jgi:hypothetical protein|tara:strand:+ start:414 stop:575 length:162 start_codon:yes stop_codon:yes gene_type:complete
MKAKLARLLLWMAGKVGHNSFEEYDQRESYGLNHVELRRWKAQSKYIPKRGGH